MSDPTTPVPPPSDDAPASVPPASPPTPPPAPAAPAQPAPGQSAPGQPVYGQPVYGQPAAGQPAYGQPAYGQPAYGQPYGYAAGPRTNVLAIVSLVLSLAGLVTGITAVGGIICGHIAMAQIKRTGENGRGLALGGVIAGYIIAGLGILLIIAYVIFLVAIIGAGVASSSYGTSS
ncbi:DUF4190 domain-containing protein [Pseudolysinimonas sp.]|uniref:DUF4190 domain-containing protein n=1 Tax=Pseudolysinimonas sp. TaxID=2680009 RepID=UPI003F800E50